MSQPLGTPPSPDPRASGSESNVPAGYPAAEPRAPAGNPVERSRFSQWLASFGLGEMPMPLLTRRKVHRGVLPERPVPRAVGK